MNDVAHHEPDELGPLIQHYMKDLVYGANDGIITTFAIVAGVTGAALAPRVAIILGVANLFADGVSMAASNLCRAINVLSSSRRIPSMTSGSG